MPVTIRNLPIYSVFGDCVGSIVALGFAWERGCGCSCHGIIRGKGGFHRACHSSASIFKEISFSKEILVLKRKI